MMLPEYTTLKLNQYDGVGHLVLNQPPSNSMSLEFLREFKDVVDFIDHDQPFLSLVISGAGRHFSSGADLQSLLSEIRQGTAHPVEDANQVVPGFLTDNYEAFLKLEHLQIPVITAIRGVCLGSALELTLFSHFRFCGEDAVFGLPECSYNLLPGLGGIKKLSDLLGRSKTLEIVLKARTFSAEEAQMMKVVHRVLPKREVVETSMEFARSLSPGFFREKSPLYLKQFFS